MRVNRNVSVDKEGKHNRKRNEEINKLFDLVNDGDKYDEYLACDGVLKSRWYKHSVNDGKRSAGISSSLLTVPSISKRWIIALLIALR